MPTTDERIEAGVAKLEATCAEEGLPIPPRVGANNTEMLAIRVHYLTLVVTLQAHSLKQLMRVVRGDFR